MPEISGWVGLGHIRGRLRLVEKESPGKRWRCKGPGQAEPKSCSRRRWRQGLHRGSHCLDPWRSQQGRRCRGSKCRKPGFRPIPRCQQMVSQAGQCSWQLEIKQFKHFSHWYYNNLHSRQIGHSLGSSQMPPSRQEMLNSGKSRSHSKKRLSDSHT